MDDRNHGDPETDIWEKEEPTPAGTSWVVEEGWSEIHILWKNESRERSRVLFRP